MKIEIDSSFDRDAKKLPDSLLDELKTIYEAIETAQSLDEIGYEVKKMEGSKKVKAFRLKLNRHSDFRMAFIWKGILLCCRAS